MSVSRPTNEQESILYCVKFVFPKLGFDVLNVWSVFPDMRILDIKNDTQYEVEFEYKLSSFIKHGHNPFKCNFVICWINDVPDFPLPVWELSKSSYPEIFLPDEDKVWMLHKIIQKKKEIRPYKTSTVSSNLIDWSGIVGRKK